MLKLIVWDLDDTLWRGTLADGDAVDPFAERIALVRAFNAKGVVSSICSKNDPVAAEAKLRELGWWDAFVFPSIAFAPKPAAVAGIIADMQLRAPDVLFVDDNVQNLEAVRFHLPEIQLLDITAPDADAELQRMFDAQKPGKSRVAAYRSLEARKRDQGAQPELSHEDFLRSCEIQAAAPFCMENLDHVERIAELMQRSNQLNYTNSRRTPEALRAEIIDVTAHVSLSIFAWDRYGDYGLVGFVMLRMEDGAFRLVHCTFSCRAMHMGLEQAALAYLRQRARDLYPPIGAIDMGEAGARIAEGAADWVAMQPYIDPAVRARVLAQASASVRPEADTRVMFGCQSGGVAHFSARRDRMAFDSYPDNFLLRGYWDGTYAEAKLAPFLVYGVGPEYGLNPWLDLTAVRGQGGTVDLLRAPAEDLSFHLDHGVYEVCVKRLCDQVTAQGAQMLVVLPAEQLADDQYHPDIGVTRERVMRFNAIWRRAFQIYPGVSTLDSDLAHEPGELKDVSHYTPAGLSALAAIVDAWHDQVNGAQAGELAA